MIGLHFLFISHQYPDGRDHIQDTRLNLEGDQEIKKRTLRNHYQRCAVQFWPKSFAATSPSYTHLGPNQSQPIPVPLDVTTQFTILIWNPAAIKVTSIARLLVECKGKIGKFSQNGRQKLGEPILMMKKTDKRCLLNITSDVKKSSEFSMIVSCRWQDGPYREW